MKGLGVGIWTFGMGSERYVSDGYKPYLTVEERIARIGQLEGVSGLEVTFPNDVDEESLGSFSDLMNENELTLCGLGVELVCDREWATGSFTSPDAEVRQKSIALTQRAMDLAAKMDVKTVSLWLGQDGFDYAFQKDYVQAWQWLIEGLQEAAAYRPGVNLALEYKTSEPQMACYVNSGGKALALAQATGSENVGVNLDLGHALNARENPAEIAAVLLSAGRLFHIHINDNYAWADDDMPVGTVHFTQYLEFFYWLHKLNYDGWVSLDLYPYREDPMEACRTSIDFVNRCMALTAREDFQSLVESHRHQGSQAIRKVYEMLFARSDWEKPEGAR